MNVISIKNGILLDYSEKYSIYEMYTDDTEEYYICVANYKANTYQVVIDFPEEYFKSLLKENRIEEIKKTCDKLYSDNKPYIYILPNITTYEYNEALKDNDDHSYSVLLKRLQKFTYNFFKNITSNNNDIDINQQINVIVDTDDDKKFMDYLDVNLNGYFLPMKLNNDVKEEINVEIKEEPIVIEENVKTKTLKKNNKLGFSNMRFIFLIFMITMVICMFVVYLLH